MGGPCQACETEPTSGDEIVCRFCKNEILEAARAGFAVNPDRSATNGRFVKVQIPKGATFKSPPPA